MLYLKYEFMIQVYISGVSFVAKYIIIIVLMILHLKFPIPETYLGQRKALAFLIYYNAKYQYLNIVPCTTRPDDVWRIFDCSKHKD